MNIRVLITFVALGALAPGCRGITDPSCSPLERAGAHAICLIDGAGSSATIGDLQLTAWGHPTQCECPGESWPAGVGISLEAVKTAVDTTDRNLWSCTDTRLYTAPNEGTLVYSANASLGSGCHASGIGFSSGPSGVSEGVSMVTELRDDDVGAHVAPGVYYARIRITWMDGTTTELLAGVVRRS